MKPFKHKADYKNVIDNYVESMDEVCPNPQCKSNDIDGGYPKLSESANELYLDRQCCVCGTSWREYYKMYDVELRDEKGNLIDLNDLT